MLAAISLLPSRRLEYWDPTLKLYSVSKDVYHFSFKVRKSEDVYGRKWLLLLVDDRKGEAESQEYWFVLHKPLLVHTAEAVNARTVQTYMRCEWKHRHTAGRVSDHDCPNVFLFI